MDHNKLNRELELECWSDKKAKLKDELERLQAAMVADTTIWNQDNTTRCATLISNLKYADAKLEELKGQKTTNIFPAFTTPQLNFGYTNPLFANQFGVQQPAKPQFGNLFAPFSNPAGEQAPAHSGKKRSFGETSKETNGPFSFGFGQSSLFDTKVKSAENGTDGVAEQKRAKTSANNFAAKQKLNKIETDLCSTRMQANAHLASPPRSENVWPYLYKTISQTIFKYITELDQVDAEGEDRIRRKELLKEAESFMTKLDATVHPSKVWKPEQNSRVKDEGRDTKY